MTRTAWHARIQRIKRLVSTYLRMWRARLSADRRGLALVYHGVVEDAATEDRLVPVVTAAALAEHARCMKRWFVPVHASRLPEAARARRRGARLPIAATFDDDLRS